MTLDLKDPSSVYAYPRYYALGYRWNTFGVRQLILPRGA